MVKYHQLNAVANSFAVSHKVRDKKTMHNLHPGLICVFFLSAKKNTRDRHHKHFSNFSEQSNGLPKTDLKNEIQKKNYFWNQCFDKGRLKNFVLWFFLTNGEHKTVKFVEQLKNLGFQYATKAGISLGIDDLKIPPKKALLMYEAEKLTISTVNQHNQGEITGVERFQRLLDTWHRTSEILKQEVIDYFEATDILNPVYMMAFSGARGNISQVRQLVGMRGLMSNPQGQIIDFPIRSNFREGLTLTEYIISSYGARKGIVDTALRTANAGYLTRRLVDVAQHVIISSFDCGTRRGIFLTDMKEGNKTIFSLQNRLVGRVLARDIYQSESSVGQNIAMSDYQGVASRDLLQNKIASRNQEISYDLAFSINKISKKVFVRSALTCETSKLVCQLCYGWSLAQGNLVSIGEAVGVVAAQSIGEPGTQLTMRTFHTGGVFSGDVSDQIKAPFNGIIEYCEPIPGTLIRTMEGKIAFLTKSEGSFYLHKLLKTIDVVEHIKENILETKKYKIPFYTLLYVRNGESVSEKEVIAQISSISRQKTVTDEAELTLKSELEGQFYSKFIDLQERQVGPKPKKQKQSSNNFEAGSQVLAQNNTLANISVADVSQSNIAMDYVYEAWTWGYAWILAGKVYQPSVTSPFFPLIGDFVNKKSYMNAINYKLMSNTGTSFFIEYFKNNVSHSTLFAKQIRNGDKFMPWVFSQSEKTKKKTLPVKGSLFMQKGNKYKDKSPLMRNLLSQNKEKVTAIQQFNKDKNLKSFPVLKNTLFQFNIEKVFYNQIGYIVKFLPCSEKIGPANWRDNFMQGKQHGVSTNQKGRDFKLLIERSSNALFPDLSPFIIGPPIKGAKNQRKRGRELFFCEAKKQSVLPHKRKSFGEINSSSSFTKLQCFVFGEAKNKTLQGLSYLDTIFLTLPLNLKNTPFSLSNHLSASTINAIYTKHFKYLLQWFPFNSQTKTPGLIFLEDCIFKKRTNQPRRDCSISKVLSNQTIWINKSEKNFNLISKLFLLIEQLHSNNKVAPIDLDYLIDFEKGKRKQAIKYYWIPQSFYKFNSNSFTNRFSNVLTPTTNALTNRPWQRASLSAKAVSCYVMHNHSPFNRYWTPVGIGTFYQLNNQGFIQSICSKMDGFISVRNTQISPKTSKTIPIKPNQIKKNWFNPRQQSFIQLNFVKSYAKQKKEQNNKALQAGSCASGLQKQSIESSINMVPQKWNTSGVKFEKTITLQHSQYLLLKKIIKKFKQSIRRKTEQQQSSKKKIIWQRQGLNTLYSLWQVKATTYKNMPSKTDKSIRKNKLSKSTSLISNTKKGVPKGPKGKLLNQSFRFSDGAGAFRKGTALQKGVISGSNLFDLVICSANNKWSLREPLAISPNNLVDVSLSIVEETILQQKSGWVYVTNEINLRPLGVDSNNFNSKTFLFPGEIYANDLIFENHLMSISFIQLSLDKELGLFGGYSNIFVSNALKKSNITNPKVVPSGKISKIKFENFLFLNNEKCRFNPKTVNHINNLSGTLSDFRTYSVSNKDLKPNFIVLIEKVSEYKQTDIQAYKNEIYKLSNLNISQYNTINNRKFLDLGNLSNKKIQTIKRPSPFGVGSFYSKAYNSVLLLKDFYTSYLNKQKATTIVVPKFPNIDLQILPLFSFESLSKSLISEFSSEFLALKNSRTNNNGAARIKGQSSVSRVKSSKLSNALANSEAVSQSSNGNIDSVQSKITDYLSNKSHSALSLQEFKRLEQEHHIFCQKPINISSFLISYGNPYGLKFPSLNPLTTGYFNFVKKYGLPKNIGSKKNSFYKSFLMPLKPSPTGMSFQVDNQPQKSPKTKISVFEISNFSENLKLAQNNLKVFNSFDFLAFQYSIIQKFETRFLLEKSKMLKTLNNVGVSSKARNTGATNKFFIFANNQIRISNIFIQNYNYSSFEGEMIYQNQLKGSKKYFSIRDKSNRLFLQQNTPTDFFSVHSLNQKGCMILTKTDCLSFGINFYSTPSPYARSSLRTSFNQSPAYAGDSLKPGHTLLNRGKIGKESQSLKKKRLAFPEVGLPKTKNSSSTITSTSITNYKQLFSYQEKINKNMQYFVNDIIVKCINSSTDLGPINKENSIAISGNLDQSNLNSQFTISNSENITNNTNTYVKINRLSAGSPYITNKLLLGEFLFYGDKINNEYAIQNSGQIIHINNTKITLRKGQPIFISPKGILHKYNNDFIDANSPVITLAYQRLKTGDIIQGIPKVEQFFEARTTKRGELFRDSLPNLLKGLFKRYRAKLPLDQAVRQSFYKIQQIIVDGVQRVYRSQGVTIADKHLEVIVKQMTAKVRIIEGAQTGFFPGEIVDLEFVEQVNSVLMKKIQYEPIVLGITKASLEVDSFLSAASFQQTTKVLSKAAISRKKDFLKGLKENVILGNLIPAGTGYLVYLDERQ